MASFILDRRLEGDSLPITELGLCTVRLRNDKRFPWLLLIPQIANASEWIDLTREQQHQLSDEIMVTSHLLQALVTPDKLNIATLGNQVPQLHIHVIARYKTDAAWPNPVWGNGSEIGYSEEESKRFIYELKSAFAGVGV
jgi:diadenosine tetraphosphate (Ap4A) HIT family hydrolase